MINEHRSSNYRIDWLLVILYLLLTAFGWLTVYSATAESAAGGLSSRAMMQGIWLLVSIVMAAVIMTINTRYYFSFSILVYWAMIAVLFITIFVGTEVNGAKSWLSFGSFRMQPAEFAKVTTALAVARIMSDHAFNISKLQSLIYLGFFIGLPMMMIVLQNDTGSALVFASFLFMLYREGLSVWVYVAIVGLVALFIASFFVTPLALLSTVVIISFAGIGLYYRNWKAPLRYVASLYAVFGLVFLLFKAMDVEVSAVVLLAVIFGISVPIMLFYSYRSRQRKLNVALAMVAVSFIFFFVARYAFDNVMQIHQQKRILNLLGIESDPSGWGYNVNQSTIAIGSGGAFGKGYMQATQTRYNFVPEHHTDFIFCTLGEELGFVGSFVMLALFGLLIFRLITVADRQADTFRRIYILSVASILLFHLIVNVGMTVGIVPVIGIPLPFFSYGGSSLLSFTILLFIAIRLSADRQ